MCLIKWRLKVVEKLRMFPMSLVMAGVCLLVGMMSCTEVGFDRSRGTEVFFHKYSATAVDVLFVLDDSCSTKTIQQNVEDGILSLSGVQFPENTQMAVTYMSPAQVIEGATQFENPYATVSTGVPGFMQLVNSASIAEYMSLDVSSYDPLEKGKERFEIEACQEGWFSPTAKNQNNQACLSAAMQYPLYCTGVEEGVWSLYQLVENYDRQSRSLFRAGSLVLVLFVSDTHAPGVASYYGRSTAPADPLSLEDILGKIMVNSPGVSSIKFSGIVPVPKLGDPLLDSLKVIGGPPLTDEEATINGEGARGYAYLPYIKGSGGVAVHAKREDWSGAMAELLKDAQVLSNFKMKLSKPVESVIRVWVDGVSLKESEFRLEADSQTVYILQDLSPHLMHEIKIEYFSL